MISGMEACWWTGILSSWFRNSLVKSHFNRSFWQPLFKTLSYSCQRYNHPATFSCCIFCSWEMSSTYDTGKIINAHHSLYVDPCILKRSLQNNTTGYFYTFVTWPWKWGDSLSRVCLLGLAKTPQQTLPLVYSMMVCSSQSNDSCF